MVICTATNYFALKSLSAKKGENVLPEIVSDWDIDKTYIEEANKKRKEILDTFKLIKTIEFPAFAARSQLGFDCWLEQLEEGWQKDHIEQCYNMMNDALSTLRLNSLAQSKENSLTNKNIKKSNDKIKTVTKTKIIDNKSPNKSEVLINKIKIFFDHNSHLLNKEALIELEYFSNKIEDGYTRILLEGHADRSGTEKYNFTLAKHRARAVKKFLIKKGLNEKTIITKVYGELRPLIFTQDGVREPKNRRVIIEISYDQNLISRL